MPVDVTIDEKTKRLNPTTEWQLVSGENITIDIDFYVNTKEL
jgi:hypothetical protein